MNNAIVSRSLSVCVCAVLSLEKNAVFVFLFAQSVYSHKPVGDRRGKAPEL
jgi:hypothetical protein